MRKFKVVMVALCFATFFMGAITVYVYAYNNHLQDEPSGGIWFSLAETEPVEDYTEIFDPLDPWTQEAINNLTASPHIYYTQLEEWKLKDVEGVFKYRDKYYTFDDRGFFDLSPGIPCIPLETVYGGWTGISIGWIATGLTYMKKTERP